MLLPVPAEAASLLPALAAALDGTGPAVLPMPRGSSRLTAAMRPADPVQDGVALVVPTSGSTGSPKGVLLTAANLTASARATEQRLGGPGQWLLALPPTHIGGLQVLVRSLLAGTTPVVLEKRMTAVGLALAAGTMTGSRRYVSLVPTQLLRLLQDDPAPLREFTAVLLGGAAADPPLLQRAAAAGVQVVRTYGMSETSGGCVYDGRPLDGVHVSIEQGRVRIAGDVVALGYRFGPRLDGQVLTGDLGRWAPDGSLEILGRADDVIVTGGVNVAPAAIEAVLAGHPAVAQVAVVGRPDEVWGQRVCAFVVLRTGRQLDLDEVRAYARSRLGAPEAPRELQVLADLPLLPAGKVDRAALRSWGRPSTGQGP